MYLRVEMTLQSRFDLGQSNPKRKFDQLLKKNHLTPTPFKKYDFELKEGRNRIL